MKYLTFQADWPASWRSSYPFDLEEVYGQNSNLGYAYAYANRRRETFALLTEVLPRGARVLDIAAAQGNFSLALAELGFEVTWNDLRGELEGYVRAKYEHGEISYAPGNAFELAFARPFDAVLATEVIEHVAHPDAFLRKAAGLVRPGGYLIMTTPNGGYFRNSLPRFSDCPDPERFEAAQFGPDGEDHIFLLHRDEIERFAHEVGLDIERLSLFTNPLTNGHLGLNSLLRGLPKWLIERIEAASQRLPQRIADKLLVHTAVRLRRPI